MRKLQGRGMPRPDNGPPGIRRGRARPARLCYALRRTTKHVTQLLEGCTWPQQWNPGAGMLLNLSESPRSTRSQENLLYPADLSRPGRRSLQGRQYLHSLAALPILSATVPPDWEKEFCFEYFDDINYVPTPR